MKVFITGGAGFIGANLAHHHLRLGDQVVVFDNLARRGVQANLAWLQRQAAGSARLDLIRGDLRDERAVLQALERHQDMGAVFHLAGQVAVTRSVQDPLGDFRDNALGTLHLLEGLRALGLTPPLIYASTNKVYGALSHLAVDLQGERYVLRGRPQGVDERVQLDFHSPYGCSKGAADQYVRDYCRIYGQRNVVLRQSCIYGRHQYGLEDQGWVAWFTIAALLDRPITIYGDGCQVRDVLFVDDLVGCYQRCLRHINTCAGRVFNVGGGQDRTLSLRQLVDILGRLRGRPLEPRYADWRPGDQRVYISDCGQVMEATGWRPTTSVEQGVARLYAWVQEHRASIERMLER